MAIPEIDQIKRCEEEVADLISTAHSRKTLAIEEAEREGDDLVRIRLKDAENRLRDERERAEKEVSNFHVQIIDQSRKKAAQLRDEAEQLKHKAVWHLIQLITGERDVLSSTNE
jgi:vacuolar-type H+-ATPase subunit H